MALIRQHNMKLTWLTDIHLNFLEIEARTKFYRSVMAAQSEAVLITGDIAEATSVSGILKEMAEHIQKPIYFVLGNHDYYRGQVNDVREEMVALTHSEKLLYWLPASGPQVLANNVILLGHDGWADGRYGDYTNSSVVLNDSRMIVDFFQQKIISNHALLEKMQQLADSDAKQLRDDLKQAIIQYHPKKIIVLTHVPPFKETCLYKGKISNEDYLPYFCSKVTGEVLATVAKINANIEFLTLCGHTHERAVYQPLDNLSVKVGQAEYGAPQVQEIFVV